MYRLEHFKRRKKRTKGKRKRTRRKRKSTRGKRKRIRRKRNKDEDEEENVPDSGDDAGTTKIQRELSLVVACQ